MAGGVTARVYDRLWGLNGGGIDDSIKGQKDVLPVVLWDNCMTET